MNNIGKLVYCYTGIPNIMDTSAHFKNISEEIARLLKEATHDIVIAIAWFTDASLFNILRNKASTGVKIKLLYLDDKINNKAPFNIRQLEAYKGKTNLYPIPSEIDPKNIMHNKFCVIDDQHVITGSYNWTNRAKYNDENIIVFSENSGIAARFLKEFDDLLEKYNYKKSVNKSPQAIIPRLEVIKNFALMEEWDSVQGQIEKLRFFTEIWDLNQLFVAINNQDSQSITSWTTDFIRDKSSIVIHKDENISELKLELKMFEFKVVALNIKKDELEKLIDGFHQNTSEKLGELIEKYLKLNAILKQNKYDKSKSEKIKEERTKNKRLKEEAEEARKEHEEYKKDFDDFKKKPLLPKLSNDDHKEIKDLFRNSSKLCHPDVVSDDQKEIAMKRFIQLKAAYDQNDLEKVKFIYDDLINNRSYTDNADTLSDSKLIKQEIQRLKATSDELLVEILALKKQINDLGIDEIDDWDEYFSLQKKNLIGAIENIEKELNHADFLDDHTQTKDFDERLG